LKIAKEKLEQQSIELVAVLKQNMTFIQETQKASVVIKKKSVKKPSVDSSDSDTCEKPRKIIRKKAAK
jgi:hypothetical protein